LGKNVYSLVLLDEVVDAVDRTAYERGMSRSGLINQILAEYLSCDTPEERIRGVFNCMEQFFSDISNFQVRLQPSDTMMNIRSALRFRYRPTIRYSLEMYRNCEPFLGELRVALRTQSPELIRLLKDFFGFWRNLENKGIADRFPGQTVPCSIEPGRYTRALLLPEAEEDRTSERVADAIGGYIRELDAALKIFLSGADRPEKAEEEIVRRYKQYIVRSIII
jgi:hypothetical protein